MPIPALIAPLLAQGLSLIGNAALAKGKDWIEEKTGIDISKASLSQDDYLKLKQFEMDHEEELIRLRQGDNRLSMEMEKMYLDDVASARDLGKTLSQSTSWLNQNIMPILALITVFGGAVMLYTNQETDVRMAAVSMMTMVLGYFFGSSKGSKDKQELLSKIGDGK